MLGYLTFLLVSLSPPDQAATTPASSRPTRFAHGSTRRWAVGSRSRRSQPDRAAVSVRLRRGLPERADAGILRTECQGAPRQGRTRRAIHFIYPSSHKTVAGNAEAVRSQFLEIARQGPEKLVVIGHSRGACDALAFALGNPEFVADHIQALFLVQGPFGGTGVADYVAGEGPPMDRRMPLRHRVIAHVLGRLEVFLLDRGKHGGLPALTQRSSEEFWEQALEEHQAAIPVVSPKTFYVTTRTEPSRLRLFQQAIAWYLAYLGLTTAWSPWTTRPCPDWEPSWRSSTPGTRT